MNSTFDLLTPEEKENFKQIEFYYEENEVKLSLLFWQPADVVKFQYQKDGDDTWIVSESKKKELQVEGKDFLTVFCDDLKILLNLPKCRMKWLIVSFVAMREFGEKDVEDNYKTRHIKAAGARIFEVFEAGLKSRQQKLQTEMIILNSSGRNQTLPILHQLDTKFLKYMHLKSKINDRVKNEFFEIMRLDLWKQSKGLWMSFVLETLYNEHLLALKEAFINSSIFDRIEIKYDNIDEKCLTEEYGIPITDEMNKWKRESHRFIQIPNTDEYLYVWDRDGSILFLRVTFDELKQHMSFFFRFKQTESVWKDDVSEIEKCLQVFENPLIMKRILEYVQFYGIQSLRKVSSGIRNCVDTAKPDPRIQTIFISIQDIGTISLHIYENKDNQTIRYVQDKEVCHVGYKTSIIDSNFRSIFFKDLEMNLRDQKACLKVFSLSLSYFHYFLMLGKEKSDGVLLANLSLYEEATAQFLEMFKVILKSRSEQLRVEELRMIIDSQNQVMEVLPYIHSLSINVIQLKYAYKKDEIFHPQVFNIKSCEKSLEIDEISKLDQWSQAKQLTISGFSISTPIPRMNITHFSNGYILVQTFSSEDFAFLKEGFLNSSSLVKFKISFEKCSVDETIYDLIGYPYLMANQHLINQRSIWYFQIPNTNSFLHILYYVSISVIFSRVDLLSVPSNLFGRK